MTQFLFDEDVKRRCAVLREYAEKPENWHYIGDPHTPGLKREHVLHSIDVQACFSWEVLPDLRVLRYLSISIKAWREGDKTRYALPEAVWTLAHNLGFTGGTPEIGYLVLHPSKTWAFGINEEEGTVCVQEEVKDVEVPQNRPHEPEGAGGQPQGGGEPHP